MTPERVSWMSDAEIAATIWVTQMEMCRGILDRQPERLYSLDVEVLLNKPFEVLSILSDHFGLSLEKNRIEAIVKGPLLRRHSKTTDTEYDKDIRTNQRRRLAEKLSEEIRAGVVCAQKLCGEKPCFATLPNGLPVS
jgi:hypothetical protein